MLTTLVRGIRHLCSSTSACVPPKVTSGVVKKAGGVRGGTAPKKRNAKKKARGTAALASDDPIPVKAPVSTTATPVVTVAKKRSGKKKARSNAAVASDDPIPVKASVSTSATPAAAAAAAKKRSGKKKAHGTASLASNDPIPVKAPVSTYATPAAAAAAKKRSGKKKVRGTAPDPVAVTVAADTTPKKRSGRKKKARVAVGVVGSDESVAPSASTSDTPSVSGVTTVSKRLGTNRYHRWHGLSQQRRKRLRRERMDGTYWVEAMLRSASNVDDGLLYVARLKEGMTGISEYPASLHSTVVRRACTGTGDSALAIEALSRVAAVASPEAVVVVCDTCKDDRRLNAAGRAARANSVVRLLHAHHHRLHDATVYAALIRLYASALHMQGALATLQYAEALAGDWSDSRESFARLLVLRGELDILDLVVTDGRGAAARAAAMLRGGDTDLDTGMDMEGQCLLYASAMRALTERGNIDETRQVYSAFEREVVKGDRDRLIASMSLMALNEHKVDVEGADVFAAAADPTAQVFAAVRGDEAVQLVQQVQRRYDVVLGDGVYEAVGEGCLRGGEVAAVQQLRHVKEQQISKEDAVRR